MSVSLRAPASAPRSSSRLDQLEVALGARQVERGEAAGLEGLERGAAAPAGGGRSAARRRGCRHAGGGVQRGHGGGVAGRLVGVGAAPQQLLRPARLMAEPGGQHQGGEAVRRRLAEPGRLFVQQGLDPGEVAHGHRLGQVERQLGAAQQAGHLVHAVVDRQQQRRGARRRRGCRPGGRRARSSWPLPRGWSSSTARRNCWLETSAGAFEEGGVRGRNLGLAEDRQSFSAHPMGLWAAWGPVMIAGVRRQCPCILARRSPSNVRLAPSSRLASSAWEPS